MNEPRVIAILAKGDRVTGYGFDLISGQPTVTIQRADGTVTVECDAYSQPEVHSGPAIQTRNLLKDYLRDYLDDRP